MCVSHPEAFDLIESPAFQAITAADTFKHPTKRENELWQTDFTYFKIIGWGWYFLSTVLDDLLEVKWLIQVSEAPNAQYKVNFKRRSGGRAGNAWSVLSGLGEDNDEQG